MTADKVIQIYSLFQQSTITVWGDGPPDNNVFYPDYAFGHSGEIKGLTVNFISPQYQLESHRGYALRPCDFLDIQRLCEEFQLPVPYWLEPLT